MEKEKKENNSEWSYKSRRDTFKNWLNSSGWDYAISWLPILKMTDNEKIELFNELVIGDKVKTTIDNLLKFKIKNPLVLALRVTGNDMEKSDAELKEVINIIQDIKNNNSGNLEIIRYCLQATELMDVFRKCSNEKLSIWDESNTCMWDDGIDVSNINNKQNNGKNENEKDNGNKKSI